MINGSARRGVAFVRDTKWSAMLNGAQAVATVSVAGLAFYAAFFSSLPEALESQLRTEVVAARQELTNVRHTSAVLEEQQALLRRSTELLRGERDELLEKVTNLRVEIDGTKKRLHELNEANGELAKRESGLRIQISVLSNERTQLQTDVATLKQERSAYAQTTEQNVTAQLVTMLKYELAYMESIANICANYGKHRRWLEANKRLDILEPALEKLPSQEKYNEGNPLYKEVESLRRFRYEVPDIWLELPPEPHLAPGANDWGLDEHAVRMLNGPREGKGGYNELHDYLVNWLFDRTAAQKGVKPMAVRSFIEQILRYEFLAKLLPAERDALIAKINNFLVTHPQLADTQINVVLESNPPPSTIIEQGKKYGENNRNFQKLFYQYLKDQGFTI